MKNVLEHHIQNTIFFVFKTCYFWHTFFLNDVEDVWKQLLTDNYIVDLSTRINLYTSCTLLKSLDQWLVRPKPDNLTYLVHEGFQWNKLNIKSKISCHAYHFSYLNRFLLAPLCANQISYHETVICQTKKTKTWYLYADKQEMCEIQPIVICNVKIY